MIKIYYSKNKHCQCGKLISNNAKHCHSCDMKGTERALIDGRTRKKYYCKDCSKKLNKYAYYYKSERCADCYHKLQKNNKEKNYCKCGKEISFYSKKCLICFGKKSRGKNHPFYKHGKYCKGKKHLCLDCKKEITPNAKRCKPCANSKTCLEGKTGCHSQHIKYKNKMFRSSYEVIYAKWLDKQKIKWLYESKTFDLSNTTYTPDFYLPETKEYIEIKGYWRNDAKKKFRLFKKQYSKIKIIILNKIELQKLRIL